MLKRFSFLALIVALIMVFSTMAMAQVATQVTVSLNVQAILTITDPADFALTLATIPGTATGTSAAVTVTTNNATGVTLSGVCSAFSGGTGGVLIDTAPNVTFTGAITRNNAGTLTPTATVSVGVVIADVVGTRTATLTLTATNNG